MSQDESREYDKEVRATYLAHRSHLRDSASDQTNSFDKSVSFIASGALSLSAIFINNLFSRTTPINSHLLFVGWGALAAALFLSLFSFLTAAEDFRFEIYCADEDYKGNSELKRGKNWWRVATTWLNYIAVTLLLLGAVLVLWFVGQNLPTDQATPMTNSTPAAPAKSTPSAPQLMVEGNKSTSAPAQPARPAPPAAPPTEKSTPKGS